MVVCEVCGSDTSKLFDPQFDLDYFICSECGFIFQDRDQLVSFEEERDEYDRHENTIDNEGYVTFFKKFIEAALKPYGNLAQGLDYGSGPEPVFSQIMARDYGVDMDIYDLHYQPQRVFEGRHYDFIVSTEVIEHVTNPLSMVEEIVNHLKPRGVVAIMTLFHEENPETFLEWWYRRDITHISFFTPKTFDYMAKQLGAEVVYCDKKRYVTLRKK